MDAFIATSHMPAYRDIFEILIVRTGKNVSPKHDMFTGTKRSINADKAALVQAMASLLETRGQFRKSDFKRLVKGVNLMAQGLIDKRLSALQATIREHQQREAIASIGNQEKDLQLIGAVKARAKKPKLLDTLRSQEAANTPRIRNKNETCAPNLVVNVIHGLSHDRSKTFWNAHRKQLLYPVHIRVRFHANDGYIGSVGNFVAYLPYGVLLHEAICVVEYETRAGTMQESYIVFPKRTPKVGKKETIQRGDFYAEACTLLLLETEKGLRHVAFEDYDDPTSALLTALDNRLLAPGDELCHEWFLPRTFADGIVYIKKTREIVQNHPTAVAVGKIAYSWYMQSTGVFTGLGTYSVKFTTPDQYRATLTNLAMVSYQASAAYVTMNPLPSTINIPVESYTSRGIVRTGRAGAYVHRFCGKAGGRLSSWEPLCDSILLITDDATGVYSVPVLFNGNSLSDNADGVVARHFPMRPGQVRELNQFTVFCVGAQDGIFLAFVPTADIRQFSNMYSVAASSLVARVSSIVDGYSYIDVNARNRLNVLVTQHVEQAYRQYAQDTTAAAALVHYGLGLYNGMFTPAAREFLRSITPDFVGALSASSNFMRESIMRTTNEKLALTAAVGVSVGVVTYGLARDLSAISNLHPEMGPALSYMVRGGLEEVWLNSITFVNPALGLALRGIVAAIEFTRDITEGVTPYSSAVHASAMVLPGLISAPLHVLYNGARGYVESHGTGQGTLTLKGRILALCGLGLLLCWYRMRGGNGPGPDTDELCQQGDQDNVDDQTPLSELFKPVTHYVPTAEVAPVPVLEKALVGEVNESARRAGVEVAISCVSLPWKPLCNHAQEGDTLLVKRATTEGPEVDLQNFGISRSSTWLCWGGSRARLPFHFESSLVNLVGGVYRRLLVPAMMVQGRNNTPIAWQAPANFSLNAGLSSIISSAVTKYSSNVQSYFVSWINSRTVTQSRKYSAEDRNSTFHKVLERANTQKSYRVSFFVKQEPTFNPSIRLIFPIEPLAELAISPFVRCMEKTFVDEMKARLFKPVNRQSIFTGGFDSLEKGAAWSTIKDNFDVNYVFAVDCTSWDSFVPGDLLRRYRELYPSMISKVVQKQLTKPSHFESSKNGQYYLRAERHTCTQLSGSPDTYILNSIANAHILEEFMHLQNFDGQSMICGDDSLMALKVDDANVTANLLVRHFANYGLTAKVAFYKLDDTRIDYCSGHFAPVQQRLNSAWVNSYAWIPNPIKFISKAFLIKTISKEDIDSALSRFLMTTYQMFKYTPHVLHALIPSQHRRSVLTFESSFPEMDYEFELKYGGFVENSRWRHIEGSLYDETAFTQLCLHGRYNTVYEHNTFFFSMDFEHTLNDLRCVTLMPDTRAKYKSNVMEYQDPVPPVFSGKLTYASLLACNPVFQLAYSEMDPDVIRARKFLERSPFQVSLLQMRDTEHLNMHMAFTNPTDLFMRINSSMVPYVFVNPATYLNALGNMRLRQSALTVNRFTQVRVGELLKDEDFEEATPTNEEPEKEAQPKQEPKTAKKVTVAEPTKKSQAVTQASENKEQKKTTTNDAKPPATVPPTTGKLVVSYKLSENPEKAEHQAKPAESKTETTANPQANQKPADDQPSRKLTRSASTSSLFDTFAQAMAARQSKAATNSPDGVPGLEDVSHMSAEERERTANEAMMKAIAEKEASARNATGTPETQAKDATAATGRSREADGAKEEPPRTEKKEEAAQEAAKEGTKDGPKTKSTAAEKQQSAEEEAARNAAKEARREQHAERIKNWNDRRPELMDSLKGKHIELTSPIDLLSTYDMHGDRSYKNYRGKLTYLANSLIAAGCKDATNEDLKRGLLEIAGTVMTDSFVGLTGDPITLTKVLSEQRKSLRKADKIKHADRLISHAQVFDDTVKTKMQWSRQAEGGGNKAEALSPQTQGEGSPNTTHRTPHTSSPQSQETSSGPQKTETTTETSSKDAAESSKPADSELC